MWNRLRRKTGIRICDPLLGNEAFTTFSNKPVSAKTEVYGKCLLLIQVEIKEHQESVPNIFCKQTLNKFPGR